MTALLTAEDICVRDGAATIVQPVTLHLEAGEPLVILGETGSGKSLLAQALMGVLPPELTASGRVTVGDVRLDAGDPAGFRGLWGRRLAVLPQEPWLSLDPLMGAEAQVAEAHRLVRGLAPAAARGRAQADLAALGLADAGRKWPHELSGGMAQRVAIAAARAGGAGIVVADEPTKGLDADRRDEVAYLLLAEIRRGGGLMVITHDLALAARIGGRLMVLRAGEVVERGATAEVLARPAAVYTRRLIAADPRHWPRRPASRGGTPVVAARGLGLARSGVRLAEDLSFEVAPGQVLGVAGPSGCGKSTLGDAMLGLVAPSAGRVERAGGLPRTAFQKLYQDPVAAFPRLRTLARSLGDVVRRERLAWREVETLLGRLALDPALLARRPDAVSGGELQRIALLRILLLKPRFIFADEPTSRLDPITQAEVIALLTSAADQEGTAVMLVSHDVALIERVADRRLTLGLAAGTHSQLDLAVAALRS